MGKQRTRIWSGIAAVLVVSLAVGPAVAQGLGWSPSAGSAPAPARLEVPDTARSVAGQNAMDQHAQHAKIERSAEANGLTPAAAGRCAGWFKFETRSGTHCSKGPMLRSMFTADQLAPAEAPVVSAADPKVTCFGSGSDGKRIQMVYARRTNKADGYASASAQMKQWAAGIEQIMVLSAQKTGGVRKPRFAHDSNCVATVLNVTVDTSVTTFQTLVDALELKGLNLTSRKYVVAWDDGDSTGPFCGLGMSIPNSTPGSSNPNEAQPSSMFAAMEPSCWSEFVAAHELMHTLGAVQKDAPHATQYGHCKDESDIMCYVDGPGTVLSQVCPASQENLYDCNNDDYFNSNPPSGNYLKTHWNPASSGWLDASGSAGPPTSPQNPTAQVMGGGSVKVSWTAPAYNGGSAIQAYVVSFDPSGRSITVPAGQLNVTVTGLKDGEATTASVAAVNSRGVGAADTTEAVIPSPLVTTLDTLPDWEQYVDMARGPAGSVYLSASDRIVKVTSSGVKTDVVAKLGTGTGTGEGTPALDTEVFPGALAVAPNGDVYFFDQALLKIRRLSGGVVTTVAGNGLSGSQGDTGAATSARVSPTAIAVNPVDSSVLFVEQSFQIVRRFTVGGTISRVAGTPSQSGFLGDGAAATAAKFASPADLTIDNSGNVYVADQNNHRVRRFAVGGNISTVAGDGTQPITVSDDVPATDTGVPSPNAVDWSSERGLLINTFGLVRRLASGRLLHFAGNLFDNTASSADGTPAGSINYGETENVESITFASDTFHVLVTGPNPATDSWRSRLRSAGPWSTGAAATAPSAPPVAPIAAAGQFSATVTWVPPSNGGSAITGYKVTTSPGGAVTNAGPDASSVKVTGLTAGTTYTFTVAAVNAIGTGSASAASNTVTPTAGPPYAPFASWSAFVQRQYVDLTTTAPSASSLSSWVSQLTAGTKTKGDLDDALRRGSENLANVDPVVRIYRAFLGRSPDASGLKFWIGRKRNVAPARTWSVTQIATEFTKSAEFVRKYGSLTNRQWVTQIYTDVLGRTADTAGVNFWTNQLDTGKKTRAQVMVGFSESNEYKTKQAQNTDVSVAYIFLMGRAPTSGEASDWVTRQKGGTTHAVLLTELLNSAGYATHITG